MVVVVVLRVRREVRNARFLIDMYVFICMYEVCRVSATVAIAVHYYPIWYGVLVK